MASVGKDRLRQNVIKRLAKDVRSELIIVIEVRTLYRNGILPDLLLDALLNQPPVRLDAVVASRLEISDEEAPGPERSAPEVEKAVIGTQAQTAKEPELTCTHVVVARG
jgi:hypothetical protein